MYANKGQKKDIKDSKDPNRDKSKLHLKVTYRLNVGKVYGIPSADGETIQVFIEREITPRIWKGVRVGHIGGQPIKVEFEDPDYS
jgi:hypothetical protein